MNNDLCISQTYSNDNVKTRLHDTYIVMNKGEINTGESNENENESVVSKNCCFKVKLNVWVFFKWVLLFCFGGLVSILVPIGIDIKCSGKSFVLYI
jgi:hypothetical protein